MSTTKPTFSAPTTNTALPLPTGGHIKPVKTTKQAPLPKSNNGIADNFPTTTHTQFGVKVGA